ncbi:MAG TPA: metalloregulator ArsR/SmtB family transcription factor [Phenylobacterium sp.]
MLDRTFAALADPTRRAIVTRLEQEGDLAVGAIAERFPISLPAVIKHLNVLSDAGLVRRTRQGRNVTCTLERAPMSEAMAWFQRHAAFWEQRLDNLASVAVALDDPR